MSTINMYRGDTKLLDLTIIAADSNPYNLTDCKLWMTAKANVTDADVAAVFIKESDVDDLNIDAVAGTATFEIFPDDTDTLTTPTVLYYDIQLKDANDRIFTLDSGEIHVATDITRDET